jgi:hypothetical protein
VNRFPYLGKLAIIIQILSKNFAVSSVCEFLALKTPTEDPGIEFRPR